MGRKLEVDLVANARPFNNTLDAAANKVTGFSGRLKALGGGSLGKGVAIGAGVAGFNLLTSSIGIAVSKLDEMHNAFLEDEASQERLANTLKNTVTNYDAATKAAEDFASAQIALGFQDDAVRDSLEQLVGMTHNYAEAQELVTLAEDLARAKNIDLAQATDVITKAYAGQARGLTALGINTVGQTGRTALLAAAWANVKNAAVNYAKTGAGAVTKANAKMNETMEKVGKAIDAVSQVAIPIMLGGLSALVDLAGAIIGAFTTAARVLNENFGPALAFIGDLARNVASPLALLADVGANIIGALGGSGGGTGNTGGQVIGPNPTGIQIHKFHSGGVVPGTPGTEVLARLQAGETVTPRGQAPGQTIIVNIASFIGSDRDIDRFSDRLAFRLRSTTLS